MSPVGTVLLIASREVRQRLRSRLFVWTTVILSVLLALLALVPLVVGLVGIASPDRGAERDAIPIAVVGDLTAAQRTALGNVLETAELLPVPHESAARQRIEDGEAQLAIIDGQRVLEPPPDGLFLIGPDRSVQVAEALALAAVLDDAGLGTAQVDRVLGVEPLPVEVVGEFDAGQQVGRLLAANVGVVFLLAVLTMYVTLIVNGIIEEKGSRVVELLVETVPVRQLLAGKLLGLGAVGLGQVLVLFGPATAIVVTTGTLALPARGAAPVVLIVAWFLAGYAFYSVVAAAFGALVSRPEEAQAVLTPTSLLMVTGYLVGFFAINAPDGRLATVAGWLPPTTPYVMLVRQLVGSPSPGEVAGAAVVVLASTVAVAVLAARIYEGAILRTGARVRLRDAWRTAGERVDTSR